MWTFFPQESVRIFFRGGVKDKQGGGDIFMKLMGGRGLKRIYSDHFDFLSKFQRVLTVKSIFDSLICTYEQYN